MAPARAVVIKASQTVLQVFLADVAASNIWLPGAISLMLEAAHKNALPLASMVGKVEVGRVHSVH